MDKLNFWMTLFTGLGLGAIFATVIKHVLDSKRDEKVKKREASILVADLLSKWVESTYLNKHSNKYHWELQSLYWKTILRLDKKLLDILLPRLANKNNAVGTNEVIVQCRKVLLGLKKTDLKAKDLNNWLPVKSSSKS